MMRWTKRDLEAYTLTELALYLGWGHGKCAARWKRYIAKQWDGRAGFGCSIVGLKRRKVNNTWLIRIEDWEAWIYNALVESFKAVYTDAILDMVSRPSPFEEFKRVAEAPSNGRYIELSHLFGDAE